MPGALQPLRHTFWDEVLQHTSGAGQVTVVHTSLQYPPGHASPVRHIGRPEPVPAAHSPSHAHGAPSGREPGVTQKPRSVAPPQALGGRQARQSAQGAEFLVHRVADVSTHEPLRQHWPCWQLEQLGGARQVPEASQVHDVGHCRQAKPPRPHAELERP